MEEKTMDHRYLAVCIVAFMFFVGLMPVDNAPAYDQTVYQIQKK
jgi:hypothetical protein